MAIDVRLSAFITRIQGRIGFCHHATYTLFASSYRGEHQVKDGCQSAEFGALLQHHRKYGHEFDATNYIPPNLYDVFGFYVPGRDTIVHSAMVVDVTPPVQLAECDNLSGHVYIHTLQQVLEAEKRCEIRVFPAWYIEALTEGMEAAQRLKIDLLSMLEGQV